MTTPGDISRALYGPPALSRAAIIRRKLPHERSDGELAYLEAYELATAFPRHHAEIARGLYDAAQAARK